MTLASTDADHASRTMGGVATRVASLDFIGRRQELDQLDAAVERGTSGDAGIVLIGGDAGMGKSRLVAEVAQRASARGSLVLEGGCVSLGEGEGLPFAPIVEALRRLPAVIDAGGAGPIRSIDELRSPEMAELGRVIPELGAPATPEAGVFNRPDWVQARIFEGLLALLRSLGEHIPVLLVVEDLHWADSSTRDVLAFLARNARTERLSVIGTYRTDELHRRHPLRPWLSEMERSPRVTLMEIDRFRRPEIDAQITAILGHRPTTDLLDAIQRRAEGNPFFVEELLAAGGEAADQLPATLRDGMMARVAALSPEAQRILGVAAVAGRTVEVDRLADVTGADEAAIEGPIREALAAQIMAPDASRGIDAYRFRHALLAEAVYDDLLPTERRRLHAAYARSIGASAVPPGAEGASQLVALAHHSTAAHEPVRALDAWVRAARAAAAAHAFGEAGRAYERAIDLWDVVPADDRPPDTDAADLHHAAALAAMMSGRNDRAVDLAQAAVDQLDPEGDPERWAAANERLARASWVYGSMDDALRTLETTATVLREAEADREGPMAMQARVMASIAGTHMLRGAHPEAIRAANEAIDLSRSTGSRLSEAHALNTLGTSSALLGDCAGGIANLRAAFALTRELNDVDDMGRSYANLSSVLNICGAMEESLAVALDGVAWARSVGAAGGYGRFLAGNAIDAAIELGRWDEADRLIDEHQVGDPLGVNRLGMINVVGPFHARRGRFEEARRLLDEGRASVERLHEAQFSGPIYVGAVELALAAGDPDDAVGIAAHGIRLIERTGDRYYLSELLAVATRAEADRAERARAKRDVDLARAALGSATAYRDTLGHWAAAASGDEAYGGRLTADAAMSTAETQRAGGSTDRRSWVAAVEAADRAGTAWRMAYTRFRLAEAMIVTRAPRREAAVALAAALDRAVALSARPLIGWIESLAKRARIEIPAPDGRVDAEAPVAEDTDVPAVDDHGLTPREREVLALLVEGQTNRQIAEALFISESTAGVHVSNILGKLGVSSRTEAAAVATRLGLDR
jgi:DNA-binding CsgD family transcriptional regulator/tetratricopeptide (TPR) repeat protein